MRVNIYHHEMEFAATRVELVKKVAEGFTYYGIRIYTEAPLIDAADNDDDSGAVTFWYPTKGKDRKPDVYKMRQMLDRMNEVNGDVAGDANKAKP